MACNVEVTNVEEKESEKETGGAQAEKMIKHCFSDPWKDSDLVLVVENEKFHVHRLILSLNSPVFEAMFKSQFKESTAKEIPLPEKNATGVLEFLKIIYGFQYIQERVEITMENVEDLLQLSDEYQVKQHIFDPCVKFLEDQTKTKENVMKIVALANLYNLEKVHQGCIDLLKNMRLESLSETAQLQDPDKEQPQYYLTQRIERLEAVLDEVYPQFFGVVASLMYLLTSYHNLSRCREHFPHGTFSRPVSYLQFTEIRDCPECRSMLSRMVIEDPWNCRYPRCDHYHFDSSLFSVMQDFSTQLNN